MSSISGLNQSELTTEPTRCPCLQGGRGGWDNERAVLWEGEALKSDGRAGVPSLRDATRRTTAEQAELGSVCARRACFGVEENDGRTDGRVDDADGSRGGIKREAERGDAMRGKKKLSKRSISIDLAVYERCS